MTTDMNKPKLGDYFYLIRRGKRYLRKITYISEKIFEFGYGGWAHVGDMTSNTNKKSKVKYIFDEDRGCVKLGKGYVFISDVRNVIAEVMPNAVVSDEDLFKVLKELPARAESISTIVPYAVVSDKDLAVVSDKDLFKVLGTILAERSELIKLVLEEIISDYSPTHQSDANGHEINYEK